MTDDADGFLARWSRRKAGLPDVPAVATEPARRAVEPVAVPPSAVAPAAPAEATPEPVVLPTMEDVAALTHSSDYSRFVLPGVEPHVKNAAMKKLFSDPHFNVMDGLDTYIDDYGKPDPITPTMLRMMNQAASLGLFDDERAPADDAATAKAGPDGVATLAVAQSREPAPQPAPNVEPAIRPDDDPDLRLQPHDAARWPGIDPGPRA